MEYADLQLGQDGDAKRVVDEMLTFGRAKGPNLPMAYAIAAIPARYALERRNWSEAATLTAPPMAFPWERFPWAEAMIAFTRALGTAHTSDISGAETEIAKLQSLKQKLDQNKDDYWAKQVEVQRLAASGMLAHAQGNDKAGRRTDARSGRSRRLDGQAPGDAGRGVAGARAPCRPIARTQ